MAKSASSQPGGRSESLASNGKPTAGVRNHTNPPGPSRYGRLRWRETEYRGERYIQVFPPLSLSLIRGKLKTTKATIEFLNEVEWFWKSGERVLVDCTEVRRVTTDATLALFSLVKHDTPATIVRLPRRRQVREKLEECGILETPDDHDSVPKQLKRGFIMSSTGGYARGREYDKQTSLDVTHFATQHLFGEIREFRGLYIILLELMLNVVQHASGLAIGRPPKEDWFISAYYDEGAKVVRFNFLDNGVGILQRISDMWPIRYPDRKLAWEGPGLLKAVLHDKVPPLKPEGEMGGQGLPELGRRHDAQEIRNLIILTNGTLGRISRNAYKRVEEKFEGSLLHWEVGLEQEQLTKVALA